MQHIVIDGYNFINRIGASPMGDAPDVEFLRERLLERLAQYRRSRPGTITVVFEAYRNASLTRQRDMFRGINVIFSREQETADDVIIGWIRQRRAGMVVVSSDRAIIDAAKAHGVPFLTPVKLESMISAQLNVREDAGDDEGQGQRGEKKGNPRRLPKRLRSAVKAIDKLGRHDH
jgi:uncharacterized protein